MWSPGHHTDLNSNVALINTMCDIVQFVVVVFIPDEISTTLACYFMQYALMKFEMSRFFLLNNGTPLRDYLLLCVGI